MACVFVAGKVEECIRRARDIVNVFHHIYCLIRNLSARPIDYVGDTYYVWRDRLCTTESILLRELGFHVQPASPVGLLISYMKILEITSNSEHSEIPQVALNFLNDALKTNVYVLFQPRILAVSAISLALDHLNLNFLLPPAESLTFPWYSLFDVDESELVACKQIILTVYDRELDTLLPLVKEELAIFTQSIKSNTTDTETNITENDKAVDLNYSDRSSSRYNRNDHDYDHDYYKNRAGNDYNSERRSNKDRSTSSYTKERKDREGSNYRSKDYTDHVRDYSRDRKDRARDYSRDRERYHSRNCGHLKYRDPVEKEKNYDHSPTHSAHSHSHSHSHRRQY